MYIDTNSIIHLYNLHSCNCCGTYSRFSRYSEAYASEYLKKSWINVSSIVESGHGHFIVECIEEYIEECVDR